MLASLSGKESNMTFGVLICRKCHRATGVDLRYKTTTCPYCNAKTKLNPGELKYKVDSEKELADIISKINRQLQDTIDTTSNKSYPDIGEIILMPEEKERNSTGSKNDAEIYEQLDPYKRIAMKLNKGRNKKDSIEFLVILIKELGKELGVFTTEDFRKLLDTFKLQIDEDKLNKYLAQLKDLDIIYEPRPGNYKLMEE